MNSANCDFICNKKEELLEMLSKPYALPLKPIPSRSICSVVTETNIQKTVE